MYGTIRSGMASAMHELAVISNNIANSGSTAFQKSDVSFADLYSSGTPESQSRNAAGLGAMVEQTRRSQAQGNLVDRDGVLNLALSGNGMFVTSRPDAVDQPSSALAYTRDGEFGLDASGNIRSADGAFILGTVGESTDLTSTSALGALTIPFTATTADGDENLSGIEIGSDGTVTATYGTTTLRTVGRIALATFSNPMGLRATGLSRFEQTAASGSPILGVPTTQGFGTVYSGKLETSNVDMTTELTVMIRAQQQFSGSAKLLQANSDMIEKLTR